MRHAEDVFHILGEAHFRPGESFLQND